MTERKELIERLYAAEIQRRTLANAIKYCDEDNSDISYTLEDCIKDYQDLSDTELIEETLAINLSKKSILSRIQKGYFECDKGSYSVVPDGVTTYTTDYLFGHKLEGEEYLIKSLRLDYSVTLVYKDKRKERVIGTPEKILETLQDIEDIVNDVDFVTTFISEADAPWNKNMIKSTIRTSYKPINIKNKDVIAPRWIKID
jgi:hypothetical protein